jgi:hypothetical protein
MKKWNYPKHVHKVIFLFTIFVWCVTNIKTLFAVLELQFSFQPKICQCLCTEKSKCAGKYYVPTGFTLVQSD